MSNLKGSCDNKLIFNMWKNLFAENTEENYTVKTDYPEKKASETSIFSSKPMTAPFL